MSYNYRVLNDNPRHFYPLSGTNLTDSTGRSNGEVIGAPKTAPPLVVGGGYALVFTGNDNFKFLTPIFHAEDVVQPFTLEAWFKPVTVTEQKGIVGHLSTLDGLLFDGEKISFTTLHGTAGAATASWYPPSTSGSFHVMGVHSGEKNELYVNGVRVGSVTLTEEQMAAGYEILAAPGYLYSGHHPGTIIVDSVAVYAHALTSRQAKLHFLWGRDVPDFRDVVTRRGGSYWDFTDTGADIAFDYHFNTTDSWATGLSATVNIEDDQISPIVENGATIEGTWMNGFILASVSDTLDGSKIWWDGDGTFTVEASLNGTTWAAAVNGQEIPGIGENFVSGSQALQVRVVFPAGQPENTISRVRSLSLRLYRDRDITQSTSERPVDFTGKVAMAQEVRQPLEHDDASGLHLYAGHAVVQAGPAVRVLEMWVNVEQMPATTGYIYDTRTGVESWLYWNGTAWAGSPGATYIVNGVETLPANMVLTPGQWNHIIAILPATSTTSFTLGVRYTLDEALKVRFGFVAAYPEVITVAQATETYNAYMGIPAANINEITGLAIADSPDTTKLYSYSWSTVGSG